MKWLLRAVLALMLMAGVATGAAWLWLRSPLALAAPSVELSIEPGTAVTQGTVLAEIK